MGNMDYDSLTPEQIADHLAKLQAKAKQGLKPKVPKKKVKKGSPKKKLNLQPVARPVAPRLVNISLRARHNINGMMYGPGSVTVLSPLANQLLSADKAAINYDEHWKDERSFLIGPARRVGSGAHVAKRVSNELFDQANGNFQAGHAPIAEVSGGEASSLVSTGSGFDWAGPQ